jgi:hypothetical protein
MVVGPFVKLVKWIKKERDEVWGKRTLIVGLTFLIDVISLLRCLRGINRSSNVTRT